MCFYSKGWKKRTFLGKRKGKELLRGPQESKIGPNVFVEVPLHENHPPIMDLSVPGYFTPSKPS
jgi:hypothetical protein